MEQILEGLGLSPLPSNSPDTIAALLWARERLQEHNRITYAVEDPNGIEELKPVRIGGIDQWLHIRGRNKDNPVILYLHGGPGDSMIGYMDAIQRPWEDYFTIVHWDQRQTGKSYYPADDETKSLTVDLFIQDTEAVIQYLRDYLNKDKLFVLGHSWGTVLAMHMAKHHPEWLHAYIGFGQVVNLTEGELILYKRLLHHAKEAGDQELVDHLNSIIPLMDKNSPEREQTFVDNVVYVRKTLGDMAGETIMRHRSHADVGKVVKLDCLLSPHLTATDLSNGIIGDKPAAIRPPLTNFCKDFMDIDLPNQVGNTFDVPIFFFSGRHDYQTPVPLSDQWFSEINAPYKELIHFEESGHFIVNEEPGKVLVALVNNVLPFAKSSTAKNTANEAVDSHG